ncbi:MetQ/NlpA family ABC transporter substrate-binding protein [Thermophilibacter provencensis]|uniref:Lipoprotein n=1 Tax=Thermophilibacter provencensis TaxID=1852386 RepID=A0A921KMR0_9ACTN|nr:MetQ/NlpA family ABC transporter substrate-binding protein [Thermophilibacter provencensis]HJF45056.1 MetQ/NlpA family ABC transporter substrate-binding protein [Thermophilibacter provencensis]
MKFAISNISRRSLLATLALAAAGSLAACGAEGHAHEHGTLRIGASPSPHAEILNDFAAPRLKERGIELDVIEYTDYLKPNEDAISGELDANYFQHINYLNNYNEENGSDLVNVGAIHYEPFGIFPGRSSDLDDIAEGATISVPNDPTNEGRALLLLQDLGLITIDEAAGVTATVNDITDNPRGIKIAEQEAAVLPSTLADVDFAVINGNYAIDAGLSLADAVATENADSTAVREQYVNIIATRPELKDDECIAALVEVLKGDDFAAYLQETFGDSVQAF